MIFPWPWAPYIPTLCIISGIAQYLVHNNLIIIIRLPTAHFSHGTCRWSWDMPFFHLWPDGFLFWGLKQCVLKHFKKPKLKILSFLVFQISSDMSLSISKVSTFRLQLFIFDFFFRFACAYFYLESLSDFVVKVHVVIVQIIRIKMGRIKIGFRVSTEAWRFDSKEL